MYVLYSIMYDTKLYVPMRYIAQFIIHWLPSEATPMLYSPIFTN